MLICIVCFFFFFHVDLFIVFCDFYIWSKVVIKWSISILHVFLILKICLKFFGVILFNETLIVIIIKWTQFYQIFFNIKITSVIPYCQFLSINLYKCVIRWNIRILFLFFSILKNRDAQPVICDGLTANFVNL